MRDHGTHYTCEFTASEMGIVALALESHLDYLRSDGQVDYDRDELADAIATCVEALSEVTHNESLFGPKEAS